ncbi:MULTISPECIES: hypothetical protein [Buttiauxella]|jgi:hypothetical protein|uniref:Lipoprotein n=1 Tax=Buttiauxella ferragutiae ATCC 51602 TaxID=1354252 RepID=A0ABX2W8W2_9ENTR|nr:MULTISPECIES: hypothetical protein [Buttiauxella]MCE0825599.1 hypothetical protein [Buttiauxella ferragutiae]OAT27917.1 hypothetical protein M976_02053 [Buttiauxella ferragutiae ATCC 51602]TDN55550.1 hypothetical protein EC843_1011634 [Buttiauxella sp. JUb87]UNK62417.1 hypothetical protein MNO13_05590 [Buttiauxella ferragutiae]
MFKAGVILCGILLSGCAAQTVNTPPPMSPMDECNQATKNGDTVTIAEKCSAITRDRQ